MEGIAMSRRKSLRGSFLGAILAVWAVGVASPSLAQGDRRSIGHGAPSGLGVEFTGCVESIGVGLIPTERARALVPPEFLLAGEGGPVTPIVVRTARCDGIAVDGGQASAGTIVQIGVVIVPPDFTGDINNYTLWYYTSNLELAVRLERVGVRAQYAPSLDYSYDPGAGGPGSLHIAVGSPGEPPLRLDGIVMVSDAPAGSFEANWWVKANRRTVKMDTVVPEIFIGGADLLLTARSQSQLGRLIGGDTLGFPVLQQFNTFATARMDVGVVGP
jgi:hypothetical protein